MWCMTMASRRTAWAPGRCEARQWQRVPPAPQEDRRRAGRAGHARSATSRPPRQNSCYSMTGPRHHDNPKTWRSRASRSSARRTRRTLGGELAHQPVPCSRQPEQLALRARTTSTPTRDRVNYLTSPQLQQQPLSYPSAANPVLPDATLQVQVAPPGHDASKKVTVGHAASSCRAPPGPAPRRRCSSPLGSAAACSVRSLTFNDVSSGERRVGNVRLTAHLNRTGQLQQTYPSSRTRPDHRRPGATRAASLRTASSAPVRASSSPASRPRRSVCGRHCRVVRRPLEAAGALPRKPATAPRSTPSASHWARATAQDAISQPRVVLPGDCWSGCSLHASRPRRRRALRQPATRTASQSPLTSVRKDRAVVAWHRAFARLTGQTSDPSAQTSQ
jgi:hypothetical protein